MNSEWLRYKQALADRSKGSTVQEYLGRETNSDVSVDCLNCREAIIRLTAKEALYLLPLAKNIAKEVLAQVAAAVRHGDDEIVPAAYRVEVADEIERFESGHRIDG